MYSLITFATQWGSKHGGINSFNTDFLKAFGIAFHNAAKVICIVSDATADEIESAKNSYVNLVKLPHPPKEKTFQEDQAQAAIEQLKQLGIGFEPEHTVWLGHDRITGAAAIEAAKIAGGRSALIHHMSYDHYESFAENSQTAYQKNREQQQLFSQSDFVLAIGPLLRDAAQDLIGESKTVHMLVPGLAEEIEVRSTPKTFVAFLSGRLSNDAKRIKQGHLGIAAFSHAHKKACEDNMPDGLCKQPKLMLRGIDFEAEATENPDADPEAELKSFAEKIAQRAINLQALPYTHDREELYDNISRASVVLMPSWHEGFGLAAWEAIAAGVPLIVSQQSGVYRLLEEKFPGNGTGCVYPVSVRGSNSEPYFRPEDLETVSEVLKNIAHQPEKARQKAGVLRSLLLDEYTWPTCAEQAAKAFLWVLQKGSLPPINLKTVTSAPNTAAPLYTRSDLPVHMPTRHWHPGGSVADSQLLRAEEELVPFDPARQPELDKLNTWLDDADYPQAVRLITGAGGLGKTRLALHLCQQRVSSDWYAGFLYSELETKEITSGWKALQALNQSLLIVIDYAETRQDELLALVKAMLQSPASQPVRLLLLARDGGEWWDNLQGKTPACEPLLSSYATTGPFHLPPLHEEIQDRKHAYLQALHAFAEALDVPAPDAIPELAGEHFGRPLYLQMAALLALHGERPTTAQGLTRALLNHERRYWHGLLANHDFSEPERHAEQLLALTTLAGGFATAKAARPYWEQASGKVLNPIQFEQLFRYLIPLYPGKQGLQAVRPDLLGEGLVAQALLRSSAVDMLDALLGKKAEQAVRLNALTVIARLSDHYQELHETLIEALKRHFIYCGQEFVIVAKETPSNLPTLAEVAFQRLPPNFKNQIANALAKYVQEESVQLAEFYTKLTSCIVFKHQHRHLKNPKDIDSMGNYANALDLHSVTLHRSGHDELALSTSFEALNLFRELHKLDSRRFESDLAKSLLNHANRLYQIDRNEEALIVSQQCSEIFRGLTKSNSHEFAPSLSLALGNYATFLAYAGRNNQALDYAKETLEIRKDLAQNDPDQFNPDLASSLGNYANCLSFAGRYSEAMENEFKALEILNKLVLKNSDRFQPDYANSLNGYAVLLSEVGRYNDAFYYAKQAVEIYERLAQNKPARFEEVRFSMTVASDFMELLAIGNSWDCNWKMLNPIPETVPQQRRPRFQFMASFMQACLTSDKVVRTNEFRQAVALWNDFSQVNKIKTQSYWLCSAAWLARYEPASVVSADWEFEWRQFVNQRQKQVPQWMLEVANRLEFKWPE